MKDGRFETDHLSERGIDVERVEVANGVSESESDDLAHPERRKICAWFTAVVSSTTASGARAGGIFSFWLDGPFSPCVRMTKRPHWRGRTPKPPAPRTYMAKMSRVKTLPLLGHVMVN